ncbi:MAG: carotenoid oxygenase family protein [Burkholderiaceae bacterium]|nr:carotenoid oxygenase family protein [Burkholderiaceae bacterium]MCZ8175608.1 carotenoid oxygenase family protein [Burkholderiaceae bacterium]
MKPPTDLFTTTAGRTALALSGALLLATAPPVQAQDDSATVEIHNVRPQQGQLMVAAFGSADTYRKKPLAQLRLPAGDAATQRLQLCGLAGRAEVALTLYQDLDGDGVVQQFRIEGGWVVHRGRLVRTAKLAREREAGRFLVDALGTTFPGQAPDMVDGGVRLQPLAGGGAGVEFPRVHPHRVGEAARQVVLAAAWAHGPRRRHALPLGFHGNFTAA